MSFEERVSCLCRQLGHAEVEVLGGLFDLTAQRLARIAIAITRNQYDAEDVVQTVLSRVAQHPVRIRECEKPWPYLLRMARNEALVVCRKKRRWHGMANLSDLLTRRQVDRLAEEDTNRAVWAALRSLPREQAEVIVLKVWEDLTFAQIGQMIDASPNTVASRYQYGLNKLSRKLRKTADEALCPAGPR